MVMKDHAVDMDRYPSVVLIEAFDKGVPNAFEKESLQVSLSEPLFRSQASHWLWRQGLRIQCAQYCRTELVLPCATLSLDS